MTRQLGLVANCRNAWPGHQELTELRPAWVRTIAYSLDDLDGMLDSLPPGVEPIVLLNGELDLVGHDWHRWPDAVAAFAQRFGHRVKALECLNEWDLLGIPADTAVWCAQEAASALQGTACTALLGSCGRPGLDRHPTPRLRAAWTGSARPARRRLPAPLRPAPRRLAHPGVGLRRAGGSGHARRGHRRPPGLVDRVRGQARRRRRGGHAGGVPRRSAAVLGNIGTAIVPAACWFAWSDQCGAPSERGDQAFGLVAEDGRRPASVGQLPGSRRPATTEDGRILAPRGASTGGQHGPRSRRRQRLRQMMAEDGSSPPPAPPSRRSAATRPRSSRALGATGSTTSGTWPPAPTSVFHRTPRRRRRGRHVEAAVQNRLVPQPGQPAPGHPGCVLHSTRGGAPTLDQEYRAPSPGSSTPAPRPARTTSSARPKWSRWSSWISKPGRPTG